MDEQQQEEPKLTSEQEANFRRHLKNQKRQRQRHVKEQKRRWTRRGESSYRILMNDLNSLYVLSLGLGLTVGAFFMMAVGGIFGLVLLLLGVALTIAGINAVRKRL